MYKTECEMPGKGHSYLLHICSVLGNKSYISYQHNGMISLHCPAEETERGEVTVSSESPRETVAGRILKMIPNSKSSSLASVNIMRHHSHDYIILYGSVDLKIRRLCRDLNPSHKPLRTENFSCLLLKKKPERC